MTPKEVLALCREKDVKAVDLRFMDFPGLWQHFTIPVDKLDEDVFEDGAGVRRLEYPRLAGDQRERHARGAAAGNGRARSVLQDPHAVDDLQHPGSDYPRGLQPRSAQCRPQGGQLPEEHWALPTRATWVRKSSSSFSTTSATIRRRTAGFYYIDSIEGQWNRGREEHPNLGYKLRYKEGYFPVPPADQLMDIRNEMMQTLIDCGISLEAQHHEVGTAGQAEIDMRFDDLVTMADKVMMYKYVVKNVAKKYNKTVTFMPKPLFGDNGSGMHTHVSHLEGRRTLVCRQRLRRAERHGALRHRRPA